MMRKFIQTLCSSQCHGWQCANRPRTLCLMNPSSFSVLPEVEASPDVRLEATASCSSSMPPTLIGRQAH